MAEDVYVVGPPRNGVWSYEILFYHKQRVSYLHQVFQDMAWETVGDIYASSALVLAFQDALVLAQQYEMVALAFNAATGLINFHETDKSALFFSLFDDIWKIASYMQFLASTIIVQAWWICKTLIILFSLLPVWFRIFRSIWAIYGMLKEITQNVIRNGSRKRIGRFSFRFFCWNKCVTITVSSDDSWFRQWHIMYMVLSILHWMQQISGA